jgi:hypothetical protein
MYSVPVVFMARYVRNGFEWCNINDVALLKTIKYRRH